MKSKFYLFLAVLIAVCGACSDRNFLDETVTTDLDFKTVFADSSNTVDFLSGIYREVGFDVDYTRFSRNYTTYGGLQTSCDEAHVRLNIRHATDDVMFVTGTVNPVIVTSDAWTKGYENIRRVNIFLQNVDSSPLSARLKTIYKAEARFLRAWYYFILLRHYGGVPLIGDAIYTMEDAHNGNIKTERDSFEAVVEYIVSECEAQIGILPIKPAGLEGGHAGSGACMALIARVRLYAASPLFNGSDWAADTDIKTLVGYPDYDLNRWKLAMDAAMRVIATGSYDLYVDHIGPDPDNPVPGYGFYRMLLPDDADAPVAAYIEEIFSTRRADGKQGSIFNPPSVGGGGAPGGYPYQEIVDAFPMKDGKAIGDNASAYPYSDARPYANRDPRFYNSIVMDSTWLPYDLNSIPTRVDIYTGRDAFGQGTATGYYIKKFTDQKTYTGSVHAQSNVRHLIRYAEILLNYAEARNEFGGPSDEIYMALKAIRERAGIEAGDDGMYGLKANMNRDEMREAIRLERRIELAFEGHRFWDVRRWMIAGETENMQMTGMNPTLNADNTKSYPRVSVRKHTFDKRMYLWPFPDSEVAKAPLLKQNPYY